MRRALAGLLVLAPLLLASDGTPAVPSSGDPVLDRLTAWSSRAKSDLRLAGEPAPHRVVTAVIDGLGYNATASFGAIVMEAPTHWRQGTVEVVVGSDELDSSRFNDPRAGRSGERQADPRQELTLAVEQGELALERDLWTATDVSYKRALQRLRAKLAARAALGGEAAPPDWSPVDPVVSIDLAPLEPPPADRLRRLAIETSAALGGSTTLDQAEVTVNVHDLRFYTATSEGTRIAQPESYAVVYAEAELVRGDGVEIEDELQWVALDADQLPSRAEILDGVRALGRNVAARAVAADVDYYEGPVVFEGRAAAQLFRYLLPPEISGTPPPPEAGRSHRHQTRQGPRLGRRVLPDGWSVTDDPRAVPAGFAGGYRHDREGVPAQRVELVADGFVRELLMSRVPRAERGRSNGHARGAVAGPWTARPAVWHVEAARNLDEAAFEELVREARTRAQLERILVVRRLGNGREGRLPVPTQAYWRYDDGREEAVSLLEFESVDRRTLRAIAGAGGGEVTLGYLAAWTPEDVLLEDRGLPSVVTAPRRVLVEDLALVFPGPSAKPRAYPRPPPPAGVVESTGSSPGR